MSAAPCLCCDAPATVLLADWELCEAHAAALAAPEPAWRKCKCGKEAKWLRKNRRYLCDSCAQEQGFLVPCTGEAHSNPFIDNCGVCMPRWGLMEVVKPRK